MLHIKKRQSNILILALSQKASLPTPKWLFSITHLQSMLQYNFIGMDVSSAPERYNEFIVVEKEDANVLSTEVNVKYTGTYHYKVFEQASDTNLIIENTTQLVAQGILWVTDEGKITTDVFFNLTEQNIIFNE